MVFDRDRLKHSEKRRLVHLFSRAAEEKGLAISVSEFKFLLSQGGEIISSNERCGNDDCYIHRLRYNRVFKTITESERYFS